MGISMITRFCIQRLIIKLGFVGDITGGDEAMGVAVEPIAKLAKEYVEDDYRVVASNKKSFNKMEVHRRNDPDWCTAGYVSHDFIE
jgi:hypothetical protein